MPIFICQISVLTGEKSSPKFRVDNHNYNSISEISFAMLMPILVSVVQLHRHCTEMAYANQGVTLFPQSHNVNCDLCENSFDATIIPIEQHIFSYHENDSLYFYCYECDQVRKYIYL